MKRIILLTMVSILFCAGFAQNTNENAEKIQFKYQARLKAGIGQTFLALPTEFEKISILQPTTTAVIFKTYSPVNDFLKTKWGFYGGMNHDFYFYKIFGAGLDFDYFNNKLEFTIPNAATKYINDNQNQDPFPPAELVESMRKNQSLIFLGVGPGAKIPIGSKFEIDVNLRAGLSLLSMGSLMYRFNNIHEDLNYVLDTLLYFDYTKRFSSLGLKAGIFGNYWFSGKFGVSLGVDYIHSFVKPDKLANNPDYIFRYKDPDYYFYGNPLEFAPYWYFNRTTSNYVPTKINVNHLAVSVGIVFRLDPPAGAEKLPKEGKNKDILVLVKDSISGIPIQDAGVLLSKENGNPVETKITGENGKVLFQSVKPGDYLLTGSKGNISTTSEPVSKTEFEKSKKVIYKELLYNNVNFILLGVTKECTENKILGNVQVELTNKTTGLVVRAKSDAQGNFSFLLEPNSDYSVAATREGYYSGAQEITTMGLNRSKTLYVDLVLCVEELEVGKTIILKMIYYDFDKCDIRKDASLELDRLVKMMKDNPNMEIELSSHTDQRGTEAYNEKLSQCRAESAVNYIVGKGINKSRMSAKGYGESRPIMDCTKDKDCPQSAEGDCQCHQNNRRTEIKITKM